MKRILGPLLATLIVALTPTAAFAGWQPGSFAFGNTLARSVGVPTAALATSTGMSSIRVNWAAPSAPSVTPTQYIVRRTAPTTATVCTVGPATFVCNDTGLNSGTTYTYTVEARVGTNWNSGPGVGVSATTDSPPNFLVSVPGTQQAGTRFQATLTATTNGVTVDTTYSGNKTITFSGPNSSPAGNAPVYPARVSFTNGVGQAQIRLYAAETVTLAVTDGTRSGSTLVTVTAAAARQLRFSTSTPSCASGSVAVGNGGSFTSRVTVYDQYLNPAPETTNRTITLTKNRPTGTLVPVSLTIPIGSSETSASFTFTLPVGNPPATRITAASGGVTNVRCVVSRN